MNPEKFFSSIGIFIINVGIFSNHSTIFVRRSVFEGSIEAALMYDLNVIRNVCKSFRYFSKELIYLALADPQEFFKKPLIKNEEQPSFWKRYSAHFGEVSIM